MDRALIIMAAGMGSRYGGLKQIEPVGPHGEWIIDYSVYDALQAGFSRIVFVVREEFVEAFRDRMERRIAGRCATAYVCQHLEDLPAGIQPVSGRVKPWGTGHAVLCCRDEVTEPFAVINADDFYGREAFKRLADYLGELEKTQRELGLVGYALSRTLTEHGTVSRGVCEVDGQGFLVRIVERTRVRKDDNGASYTDDGISWTPIPENATASMNAWAFPLSFFETLAQTFRQFLEQPRPRTETAEFLIPTVVGQLIDRGKAKARVLPNDAQWFGVTHRDDLPHVREQIARLVSDGLYPSPLAPE